VSMTTRRTSLSAAWAVPFNAQGRVRYPDTVTMSD
jgi:hypothetical protein